MILDLVRPTSLSAGDWLRRLTLVALDTERRGTLRDAAAVLGAATDSQGVILWESPQPAPGDAWEEPSVLSVWLERGLPEAQAGAVTTDQLTHQAFQDRTLALPRREQGAGASLFGLPIYAAMPLDYADGCRGALTLLGEGALTDVGFDTAAELLKVLPQVLTTLRERCTLALVNSCNQILHEADVESPLQPLPRERLQQHLARVCTQMAAALQCTEVSIFLQEPSGPDGYYAFFAASDTSAVSPETATIDAGEGPPRAQVSREGIQILLASGDHAWGLLRCRGANVPPFHFTHSDLSLLYPVAAQVARYWANWLHRWTISLENESWRRLAAGITRFNKLLAEELRGSGSQGARRRQLVTAAAIQLVQEVVHDSTGAVVSFAPQTAGVGSRLDALAAAGPYEAGPATSPMAEKVYRTGRQTSTTEPRELARNGAEAGWLLNTPIKVGDKAYGVLTAFGPAASLPTNSPQVYEIVGDQLGLYRHLEHTLDRLQEAQHSLKISLRGQAEAMDDLKHQLVSPLRIATDRTELALRSGRFDTRLEAQLRAVRGLCRKASRVAMSAGVFATLSKGQLPVPRSELLGVEDLLLMLIAAADDAQLLSNPKLGRSFDVDRDSVRDLRLRLVDADTSFLQQCLGNLLDNAGKYSYAGTRVRIAGTVADETLALHVTSTGLRLGPADAARCLERNWRGSEARNSTGEGSGIGLWIVDNLMRSMKGRVEVNALDDTTTVRLVLPLA